MAERTDILAYIELKAARYRKASQTFEGQTGAAKDIAQALDVLVSDIRAELHIEDFNEGAGAGNRPGKG